MTFSNWPQALIVVGGMASVILGFYIVMGIKLVSEFHRGIKKIWLEREGPKPHLLLTYFVGIIAWPWVDWDNVELHDNWSDSIQRSKNYAKDKRRNGLEE